MYFFSAVIGGAVIGFFLTFMIYTLTFWISIEMKVLLLFFLSITFFLYECKLITLRLPSVKWQVPSSWLQGSRNLNMLVWGLILGSGMFTYIPFTTFCYLYFFTGFLYEPMYGFLAGSLYGAGRTSATFGINAFRCTTMKHSKRIVRVMWGSKSLFRILTLLLYIFFLLVFYVMLDF